MDVALKNVVRRWQQGLADAEHALVFSPYMTSSTADTVLLSGDPSAIEVHTVFSALHFANGSSSLRTLRRLRERGCKLYHLNGLHAKVILVPQSWASVGSQNLTTQGTKSREATVFLDDPRVLRRLEKDLERWLNEREPITVAMLDDMESLLPAIRRAYRTFKREVDAADAFVATQEEQRRVAVEATQRDAEQARIAAALTQRRIKKLRRSIAALRRSGSVHARVELLTTGSYGSSTTTSLFASQADLTSWGIGKEAVTLRRIFRYLIVSEDSGKIGWARVGQTRITFVGPAVSCHNLLLLGSYRCRVSFRAEWERDRLGESNLTTSVAVPGYRGQLNVTCWFSVSGLEFHSFSTEPDGISRRSALHDVRRFLEKDADAQGIVLRELLSPFRYTDKLYGVQADRFFGPIGTTFDLDLAHIGGSHVLVAARRYG